MVTLAQRITELRTQKGLSRPELSAALGLPKNAAEKFETGRQTPTQEQQGKLAAFFGVSLAYLRGESSDPTRQDSWMEAAYDQPEEPAPAPRQRPRAARPAAPQGGQGQASVLDAFVRNGEFRQLLRDTVLEVLRSPEGQELLSRTVRRELDRQK